MANEITISQLASSIPDVVQQTALKARYAASKIFKQVLNADKDVQRFGDRVSLNIMPTVSVNDVGTGGSVTNQQLSLTGVEITVNKWKETTVDIDDQAIAQSAVALLKEFTAAFGQAIGKQQDVDVASLHSSITTNTLGDTSNPGPLDDSLVRQARLKLDKLDVPEDQRMWIISPDAHADLLGAARFTDAQNTGFSRGVQVDGTGKVSMLYGDPVVVSNNIRSSGSACKNLYIQKECLGVATQKNLKVETLARTKLSTPTCGHVLYGVGAVREGHGVVVNTLLNTSA